MSERPENVLTDEEIRETAAKTGKHSPWAMWAPSVLGATILHLMAERNASRKERQPPPCGHFRHWDDGVQDDGTGDWEACDKCCRLVCFDVDCPNGWRWVGGDVVCYQHPEE